MEKNEKNCQKAQELTKEELEQVNGGISDDEIKTAYKILFGR
jgi:bacteriocin-like protein